MIFIIWIDIEVKSLKIKVSNLWFTTHTGKFYSDTIMICCFPFWFNIPMGYGFASFFFLSCFCCYLLICLFVCFFFFLFSQGLVYIAQSLIQASSKWYLWFWAWTLSIIWITYLRQNFGVKNVWFKKQWTRVLLMLLETIA